MASISKPITAIQLLSAQLIEVQENFPHFTREGDYRIILEVDLDLLTDDDRAKLEDIVEREVEDGEYFIFHP